MSQETANFTEPAAWTGPDRDANDQRFADIIESATLGAIDETAVLVGEPYDGAAAERAGARGGPKAIRAALADVRTHHFDAGPVESVGDVGSIELPAGESVEDVHDRVESVAAAVHESDAVPIFLGGDGSLTDPNVAPLLAGPVTDGGFGDDEEEGPGEVEHFDPTGGSSTDSADDEDEVNEEDDDAAEESEDGDEQEAGDDEAEEEDAETEDEDEAADDEEADTDTDEDETGEFAGDDEGPGAVETIETEETIETGGEAETVEEEAVEIESASVSTAGEGVGVVSLDAHLDCAPVDGQPSSVTSYRRLLSEGLDALAVVGARHFETATAEAEYLHEQGGEIVTAEEVGEDAVDAADRALDAVADVGSVYLSIDLDVLDVTAAPGVSTPTPGGISTRELFRIVRLLASDDRLAGVEIVETAPSLCPDGRSARAAARTVAHALSVAGR